MLRIDIHTHIMPENMPRYAAKFGYDGFVHLHHHAPCRARMMIGDKFFREIEDNCWSPSRRLEDMAQTDVHTQVLSTIPVLFNYWAKPEHALETSQYLNDHIAECCNHDNKRFIGLATLPLQDPQLACKELERCATQLGIKGIEIGTHINDWNLNEPELFPIWEICEKYDLSVLVHPWDMPGAEKMRKYWLPWLVGMPAESSRAICSMIFGGVFDKFPKLRVAFCHGGGSFAGTIGRIEHGFKMRPDLVAIDNPNNPRDYCGKFWVDTLTFDEHILHNIIRLFGSKRVALGSDYPFPLGELDPPGKLAQSIGLDPNILEDLFQNAPLEWLNMKAEELR